ncbi:MAG: EAL domain-containing protein [Oscillospiraceae bacterium]|nr:EAL domain-containing protein [Oscillospiraceae bacterium]
MLMVFLRKFAVMPFIPHRYTPVGDIAVLGLAILVFVLLLQNYSHRNKGFRLLINMLAVLAVTTAVNIFYNQSLSIAEANHIQIYVLRIIRYLGIAFMMFLYLRYLSQPFWIRESVQKTYAVRSYVLLGIALVGDVLGTVFRFGFYIGEDGTVYSGFSPFFVILILSGISIYYTIIVHRSRVITQIFWGLLLSNCVTVGVLIIQFVQNQAAFTQLAIFFPLLGLVFLFHSNPYDIDTGAVSEKYFYEELGEHLEKGRRIVLMSCNMQNFAEALKYNKRLKMEYYQFFRQNVQKGVLYQFPDGRLILSFAKSFSTQQDAVIARMLEDFKVSYSKFNIDYKIVVLETTQEIMQSVDYVRLIKFIENTMLSNTIYRVREDDIHRFYKSAYILSELEDIAQKKDLDDERIVVYCQPVFNLRTGAYDTAESLMRLQLDRIGMVYPDLFIPLAEQNDLIHAISLIILNKTCGAVRTLLEDGYDIKRISVNFSTVDLRYESFCKEVQQIISRNQIGYDKIAIEITESQSEADFKATKAKIIQLQRLGIKFYLDDFGTGYSNFERIMEIPFDIIKFDRSLLLECSRSEASYYMVSTFARMFTDLQYAILFEGIESEEDESACEQMHASYLQGYKYSKPIPIDQLKSFLYKKDAS